MLPPVGRKVEKDCAAGHIDQVDTQPVDVMTAKTPEHKEPLFSPGHAAQQKREVYHTKGNVLPNQSDTKCYDKERPEPGTHEPKKACKAKEDEDFTESDREARETIPYIVYICLQVIQCFWVLVGSETLSITCPTRSVSTDIVSRFAVYFCMCFCFKTATGESTKSKDHEDGPAKTQTCQESKSG